MSDPDPSAPPGQPAARDAAGSPGPTADGPTRLERRRPGRRDDVSPQLIPLLRRQFGGHRGPADTLDLVPGPVGCGACRDAQDIFPFSIAFQPIIDLHGRRIDGHEALVRGPGGESMHSVLSQVTPQNLYAFDQACRVKAIELASRLGLTRGLSINFLPNAVYDPRACIQLTLRTAQRTDFPLHRLTFEIMESEAIADTAHLVAIIAEYRRHGFRVALDDFGTGHSGLARLIELRPDTVKVDRVLTQGCDSDPYHEPVLAALVRMGEELGVKLVFEGVETPGELAVLRRIGARFVQGYLFARPAFEAVLGDADIGWQAAFGDA